MTTEYINMTPAWRQILPTWRRLIMSVTESSKPTVMENFWIEMNRMAKAADRWQSIANTTNGTPPALREAFMERDTPDEFIDTASAEDLLNEYLEWNGIIGYSHTILEVARYCIAQEIVNKEKAGER